MYQFLQSFVQLRVLGWPVDSPRVTLDHERFAYAGNFATGRTGIAVAVGDEVEVPTHPDWSPSKDDVFAAASFDGDRAAENALRIRYVSVRDDLRGEGFGPELLAFVVEQASERGFDRVRIGVNNPIAYQAGYRAGFAFTGEESGMGELVLEASGTAPGVRSQDRYCDGLERFTDRDLPPAQASVVERNVETTPPGPVSRE